MNQYLALFVVVVLVVTSGCTNLRAEDSSKTSKIQQELLEYATVIHERALVIDAHADIEIPGKEDANVGADGRSKVEPDKMRLGRLDAVVMAVAVGPGPRNKEGYEAARALANEKLASILALVEDPNDDVVLVRSPEELVKAHRSNQRAIILGFQNARILGLDVSKLNDFYGAGVRVFALAHMGHNDFADSSRPYFNAITGTHEVVEEHGGLSDLGVQAINRINELGAVVDITQLSKAGVLQVLSISTAPVIASHSNVRTLSNVSRNLSDEEIDGIAVNGGVIHVAPFKGYLFDSSDRALDLEIRKAREAARIKQDYYYPYELYWEIKDPEKKKSFMKTINDLLGPGSVNDLLNHIDYIIQRVGVDHVGIGTDFNHGSGIAGFNDASEALNVTIGLLERGYSAEEIEKIWGGNFLRVFREASKAAL